MTWRLIDWSLKGPDGLALTKEDVVRLCGFRSVRSLDRKVERGEFPRGTPLTGNGPVVWTGLDIACWMYLASRMRPAGQEEPTEADEEETP